MKRIEEEVERMVALEFDGLKGELEGRLLESLGQISQQELQSVIVSVEERERY